MCDYCDEDGNDNHEMVTCRQCGQRVRVECTEFFEGYSLPTGKQESVYVCLPCLDEHDISI